MQIVNGAQQKNWPLTSAETKTSNLTNWLFHIFFLFNVLLCLVVPLWLSVWSPQWGRDSWLLCFSLFCYQGRIQVGEEVPEGGVCVCGGGGGGFQSNPLWLKIHFHGKFWRNLINLGYRFYPEYSHSSHFTIYFSSKNPPNYLYMWVKLLDEWQTV